MPVNRLLLVVSIFVLGLVVGFLVLGYFAYIIETGPPDAIDVAGLEHPVSVQWASSNVATIEAVDAEDAFAGLGYAQASRRTWPMLFYRAAALGELYRLVGERSLAADKMAIRLELAAGAQRAFDLLAEDEKELLRSFAAGVNAALSDKRILREPELIFSHIQPEPWEAWHSIAVERLFAWLGADADTASDSIESRPLREVLLLHDFNSSTVVSSVPPLEPGMYVRYVFGSSALPVLFEAKVQAPPDRTIHGACLLGTPFFIAGRVARRAWSFLPTSHYNIHEADTANLKISYHRLPTASGRERLLRITTDSAGVVLETGRETASAGPTKVVTWSGLGAISDASAWIRSFTSPPTRFALFDGDGISISDSGSSTTGPRSYRSSFFLTVGESPWRTFAMARLDSLAAQANGFYPRQWFLDTYSIWASQTTPLLIAVLDSSGGIPVRDAAEYLRNWDHSFDGASIAASIFGVWAETTHEHDGQWPGIAPSRNARSSVASATDARSLAGRARWSEYLSLAVARLAADFGTDLSTWRWERVNQGLLRFPVLGTLDPGRSRFVPTVVSGTGHPSTPFWGPPEVYARLKPTSFWEGWTLMEDSDTWVARRLVPETDVSFRGSFGLSTSRHPVSIGDAPGGDSQTTTLRPYK